VEYGRALRTAGDASSAADQFQQAVRLQPQRIEARAELAAMAPEPTPTREPTAAPEPQVVVREPAPAPVVLAPTDVPRVATPAPEPRPVQEPPPGCDVHSVANACPLGDGAHVQDTIAAPEGRPSVDSDALGGKESLLGGPGGDLGARAEAELPE